MSGGFIQQIMNGVFRTLIFTQNEKTTRVLEFVYNQNQDKFWLDQPDLFFYGKNFKFCPRLGSIINQFGAGSQQQYTQQRSTLAREGNMIAIDNDCPDQTREILVLTYLN